MAARRIVGAPLAIFALLSLACVAERSIAPSLTSASFSLQSAPSRFYEQHNLVSDGAVPADLVDAALVNAWGLVASATSPWWIADNGADRVQQGPPPPGVRPFRNRDLGGNDLGPHRPPDGDKKDDVAGVGHGFVNAFDTDGHLLRRVASRGRLNSPWGLALAPADFGQFGGNLLVGNFGDGHINAFDLERFEGSGELQERGQLHAADGPPVTIDGLWALAFGNGASAGPTNALFFTAGPFDEEHGLVGTVVSTSPPGGARP